MPGRAVHHAGHRCGVPRIPCPFQGGATACQGRGTRPLSSGAKAKAWYLLIHAEASLALFLSQRGRLLTCLVPYIEWFDIHNAERKQYALDFQGCEAGLTALLSSSGAVFVT